MAVIRTYGKLHFEDLAPFRFEDMARDMVYRTRRWSEINHFGRTGSDQGVDIHGIEELDNGTTRTWFVQCKRYARITAGDLRNVVDKAVPQPDMCPDVLLLVVSCDVSKKNTEVFKQHAASRGIGQTFIWSSSVLEARLYAEYPDLLFCYFGISLAAERRNRVATLRRNIRLKQKLRSDLTRRPDDPTEVLVHPDRAFRARKLLIRSIDDTTYPEMEEHPVGISTWFEVEPYRFYYNGLEVIIGVQSAVLLDEGAWRLCALGGSPSGQGSVPVFVIGRIPYENVIDYDLDGDEYSNCPHLFCDFRHGGEPYEEIVYSTIGGKDGSGNISYPTRLENSLRVYE